MHSHVALHVFHSPRSSYAYAVSRECLHLRLRVGRGEVGKVHVVYGDPFRWDIRRETEMPAQYLSQNYDWFETDISLPDSRYAYYFVLETAEGSFQYGELGLTDTIDPGSHGECCFHYQHLSESEIFLPPAWVQDSLFYLVFPDRFRRPGSDWDDGDDDLAYSSDNDVGWKGGTLAAVIDSLSYLKKLGVSVLYFTPIFKAQSYHRYDTINYYEIDPLLGTGDDFRRLVQSAHAMGMKVILDAVFNHCGSEFPPFKDLVEKGKDSAYSDWFYVKKFPIDMEGKMRLLKEEGWSQWFERKEGAQSLEFETFAFTPYMPRFRTSNPEVQKYLLDVALHWIREYDIDGWRLDVADEVSPDFWRLFRRAVKAEKPTAYIVGEVWYDSRFWLDGTQFDAVMNYPVLTACMDFFVKRSINSGELSSRLSDALMRYSWPVNMAMMNLFESHDTDRFLSAAEGDVPSLLLAYAFILTFPGAPLMLYGSEVGMTGRLPHGNRRPMNWNPESWNMDILPVVQHLTALRRETPALRRGTFAWITTTAQPPAAAAHQPPTAAAAQPLHDDLVAFVRSYEGQEVSVYINRSHEAIPVACEGSDLSTGEAVKGHIDVPARGWSVLCS